jgi:hypothetical protein
MYSSFIRRKLINVEAEAVEKSAEGMPTALRAFFSLKKRRNAYCFAFIFNLKSAFFFCC